MPTLKSVVAIQKQVSEFHTLQWVSGALSSGLSMGLEGSHGLQVPFASDLTHPTPRESATAGQQPKATAT